MAKQTYISAMKSSFKLNKLVQKYLTFYVSLNLTN